MDAFQQAVIHMMRIFITRSTLNIICNQKMSKIFKQKTRTVVRRKISVKLIQELYKIMSKKHLNLN